MRHKYNEDHPDGAVDDCVKCTEASGSGKPVRESVSVGDGLPYVDFFEDYNVGKKNHIWLKHLDDLNGPEKYYVIDNIFGLCGIDKYNYLIDVVHKNVPQTTLRTVDMLVNGIRRDVEVGNVEFSNFEKIFAHDIYANL